MCRLCWVFPSWHQPRVRTSSAELIGGVTATGMWAVRDQPSRLVAYLTSATHHAAVRKFIKVASRGWVLTARTHGGVLWLC